MAGTFSAGHVQRVRSYRSHTKSRFDQRRWLSVPAMPQIVANKCEMALKMGGSLTVIGRGLGSWGAGEGDCGLGVGVEIGGGGWAPLS